MWREFRLKSDTEQETGEKNSDSAACESARSVSTISIRDGRARSFNY